MSGDNCTVCPRKCSWKMHKNHSERIINEFVTVEIELTELKQKYVDATSKKSKTEQILDGLQLNLVEVAKECLLMQ